ncbi:unnamed protein product, partial [Rhizoctonia solani]
TIYLPKVRGTASVDEDAESVQSDDFERSFAIRWLTGFIARGEEWTELYTDEKNLDHEAPVPTPDSSIGKFQTEFLDDTYVARTTALDRAAALLGACAGTSASGTISRELKFATSPSCLDGPDSPITISLQDESISTGDHTAVGLQTWGSACILAERIARDPIAFGLPSTASNSLSEPKGARILELGAGTGLLSLLAGKLVERAGKDNSNYTIIATDYHSAVLDNLRANVQSNFSDSDAKSGPLVDVRPLDWSLYLTGKPTTDLSRAPSTAHTPIVGTPVSGSGQNATESNTLSIPPGAQGTSIGPSPVPQTPSFSIESSISTPATSHSPQTPQTPRIARSPPTNLARALFSRLVARGLKFEMPGGPPGIEQSNQPDSFPGSPNQENDPCAHNFDSAPMTINFDPLDSDAPMIETNNAPSRVSNPLLPLDASRSELLCANIQDGTDHARSNRLVPCLDEINAPHCLDTKITILNTGEDHPANSHVPVPYVEVDSIGDADRSTLFGAVNKVVCLENDSAVGTETPPLKIAEHTDGPVQEAPQMASPIISSTHPLGEMRAISAIDYEPKIDTTVKAHPKLVHGNEDNADPSNLTSNDTGRKTNRKTPADPSFDQPFDVILGADIVYELSHITLVRGVVERLLRKPSDKPGCPPAYFHLIMPLRPTHADEANSVDMAFPRAEDVRASEDEVLAIIKAETYARSAGVGRADEVQYVHYCVGWV